MSLRSALIDWKHDYSPFAGRVLAAHIFHRILQHILQNWPEDYDVEDIEKSPFWIQHWGIDNDLVIMMMFMPSELKTTSNGCQNAIFNNAILNAANICLQRAALWKCRQTMLPEPLMLQFRVRLLPAAQAIVNIIRTTIDVDAAFENPLLSFAAYMASLVFLDDAMTTEACGSAASLELLLHIMVKVGASNAVTASLALQLTVEMQKGGINIPIMGKVWHA